MKPLGDLNVGRGGLKSYGTRHCGNGNPDTSLPEQLADHLQQVIPDLTDTVSQVTQNPLAPPPPTAQGLADDIVRFLSLDAGREIPAPPCVHPGPFTVREGEITTQGETAQFPHVRETASSTSSPR